jgi:hypothetical protein
LNALRISVAAIALILLAGCLHIETGRQVIVDLARDEIAIVKHERVLAGLSIDGPLPRTNESAYVISHVKLGDSGKVVLSIPENASSRYGALAYGQIILDFKKKSATVRVHPAKRYSHLDLDGEYPIVFDHLWKKAPIQAPEPTPISVTAPAAQEPHQP